MSVKLIYSVFDAKAEAFLQPIFVDTKGIVGRMFSAAVNDPSHDFHKFAEDYTLFELGMFHDEDGSFEMLSAPRAVATAVALRKAV